jgi:cyclophilin family peptidyl-prolyl cis-trans isomerase
MIVRHAVASRIGPTRPEIAEAALADAHVNVRLAALDALGEAGACRAPCASRLDRPEAFAAAAWHEGAHALVALARTDASAARPHVARAADAATWQVRMYAARAALYTRQANEIARLAVDREVNVRHAALASWRGAKLPGLTAAAVAALGSDDGQLVLEAVAALGTGTGERVSAGVAAGQPDVAAGLVPRSDVVAALRAALARLTAQKRETSRDPRVALIERIHELDEAYATTLRPWLNDFDPFVAARVAGLLKTVGGVGRLGEPALPAIQPALPTMAEVERLASTTVTLRLKGGRALTLRLYAEQAPTAVARFVAQVRAGEWNGRTFHRVEPGFVVQGGSPAANEYAGAATFTRDEFSSLSHVRGTIGISTRGPDTGDGQIFVNLVDNARLDFAYTVIGSIVGDASPIDDIVEGEVIESATASQAP